MKELKNYIEYQLEMISEALKNDEAALVLSERLSDIIRYIDSPIASKLYSYSNRMFYNVKVTLIDINDKKDTNGDVVLDSVTFSQPNKVYDYIAKNKITNLGYDRTKKELTSQQHAEYNHYLVNNKELLFNISGRSETTIGRVVKKLFGDEFNSSEIEDFVNKYKTLREKPIFELVNGDDIVYWYDSKTYVDGDGTLNNSCMNSTEKSNYIKFYAINKDKVSLLILKDNKDSNKIKGRALIWYLDEPKGRVYMDRIYTTVNYLENHFIDYAKKNGWIYKSEQNMYETTDLIDTVSGEIIKKISVNNIKPHNDYPYMDTLKYFNKNEEKLSNYKDNEKEMYKLESTHGSYSTINRQIDDLYWSDYYNRELDIDNDDELMYCEWIDDYRYTDDCYYSDYYDVTIDYNYANTNMINCKYNDDEWDSYRKPEDTVEMYDGEYATEDWARLKGVKKSNYLGGGVQGAVWSEYYRSYIGDTDDKSILKVRLEPTTDPRYESDWRIDDDETFYEYNGYYFDNNVKKEDIK